MLTAEGSASPPPELPWAKAVKKLLRVAGAKAIG